MTNQDFLATFTGDDDKVDLTTDAIPTNFDCLRTSFRGTTAPPSPVAGQVWDDTTTGTAKKWDGSAWIVTGPLDMSPILGTALISTIVNTTATYTVFVTQDQAVITSVTLYLRAATTSTGSNYWTLDLKRDTDDLSLLSSPPTTNGADFVAKTGKVLTPNQNSTIGAAGKGLALVLTKTGSATDLVDMFVVVRGYETAP